MNTSNSPTHHLVTHDSPDSQLTVYLDPHQTHANLHAYIRRTDIVNLQADEVVQTPHYHLLLVRFFPSKLWVETWFFKPLRLLVNSWHKEVNIGGKLKMITLSNKSSFNFHSKLKSFLLDCRSTSSLNIPGIREAVSQLLWFEVHAQIIYVKLSHGIDLHLPMLWMHCTVVVLSLQNFIWELS